MASKRAITVLKKTQGPLSFGAYILGIRTAMDLTLAGMTKKLGITKAALLDIEKGRTLVSPQTAIRFAKKAGFSENVALEACLQDQLRKAKIKKKVQIEGDGSILATDLFPELTDPEKTPGVALKGVRLRLELTQKELAKKIGLTQRALSLMEKGNRPIGKTLAVRIGKVLGVNHKRFLATKKGRPKRDRKPRTLFKEEMKIPSFKAALEREKRDLKLEIQNLLAQEEKEFCYERARRVLPRETEMFRKAVERKLGTKRETRPRTRKNPK